ncbi:hypothetical protein L9F63_001983, partial [Diploptera punctata]
IKCSLCLLITREYLLGTILIFFYLYTMKVEFLSWNVLNCHYVYNFEVLSYNLYQLITWISVHLV